MMHPHKTPVAEALIYRYVRWLAGSTFRAVRCAGLEHLRGIEADRPVLAVANHSGWWDGFMIHLLTRAVPERDFFCMMEEKQLRQFPFLTRIGAFSMDVSSGTRAAAALRFTLRLVVRRGTLVWMFPQGEMVLEDAPIRVRPGAAFLLRRIQGALLMPVAFRYGFRREQKPEAWIQVGRPLEGEGLGDEQVAGALEAVREELRTLWHRPEGEREMLALVRPRLSVNKRWEWVKRACTGRLAGFEREN